MSEIDTSVLVAIISLMGTLVVAYLNKGKFTKSDAIKLENRLASLETKIEPIWNVIVKQIPKMFAQSNPITLNSLLKKATDSDITKPEKEELKNKLTELCETALKENNIGKAMALALYNATIKV